MRIDLEAHFYGRRYVQHLRARAEPPREELVDGALRVYKEPSDPTRWHVRDAAHAQRLEDMAALRLEQMDAAGVDVQVVSLAAPGCEQFGVAEGTQLARLANDDLAACIAAHPDRFVGFAALAPQDPAAAADELERAVTELRFRGAKLNSHVGASFLDDERFLPIFERAAALRVPLNIHPVVPHDAMVRPYQGYGWALVGPGLGYGAETAVQVMRLVHSGLFDRLPELQLILGHLGEGLYFWLYRLDFDHRKAWLDARTRSVALAKPPSQYLRDNVHVTISGNFLESAYLATVAEIGADRVMFASDYPFETLGEATAFADGLPISAADRERLLWRNAATLLGLEPLTAPAAPAGGATRARE